MKTSIARIANATLVVAIFASLTTTVVLGWQQITNNIRRDAIAEGYNTGYDEGYDDGYERAQQRYERDFEDWRWSDDGIWQTYHDCDMYGLPDYAKPYCDAQKEA